MVKVNTPPETPPSAPRAGADLQTDSSGLGSIELPVWVADISTPGEGGSNNLEVADGTPTGYTEGTGVKAPDSDMRGNNDDRTIWSWLRDNAPDRSGVEPILLPHEEFYAGLMHVSMNHHDMLLRGAVEAGTGTEVVASADRAGEPGMKELTRGKGLHHLLERFTGKANQRINDISKGPGRKP